MNKDLEKIIKGYQDFRDKYVHADLSVMRSLARYGQKPQIMIVACCDSRVDPAVILQCDPGDLFVVRNVANIVPPYEKDEKHHGTSAALEFGICFLKVEHLILLGHSQCGGIQTLLDDNSPNDFINNWMSLVKKDIKPEMDADSYAKASLHSSYMNCMDFPWIKERVENKTLIIHQWFFDIKSGKIYTNIDGQYHPLA